jgi:hypothetical protein
VGDLDRIISKLADKLDHATTASDPLEAMDMLKVLNYLRAYRLLANGLNKLVSGAHEFTQTSF